MDRSPRTTSLADFLKDVREMNGMVEDVLDTANKEYALEESKFNNFHITAMILEEICPELRGIIKPWHIVTIFMLKHMFALWGRTSIREPMDGRYMDAIAYLHLHRGVILEYARQQEEKFRASEEKFRASEESSIEP